MEHEIETGDLWGLQLIHRTNHLMPKPRHHSETQHLNPTMKNASLPNPAKHPGSLSKSQISLDKNTNEGSFA